MPVGGGVICRPAIAERGLSGASHLVGLTVEGWHSQTTRTAIPGKLWFPRNRGTNMTENAWQACKLPHPLPAHVIVPNVRVKISEKPEFSRNSRPMDREGPCMDYKTHWVSNSRKSKKYPAEEGTRGMPFLYGNVHFRSYLSPCFSETRVFPAYRCVWSESATLLL